MPGELWRSSFQYGLEVAWGTSVPATRKAYFRPDSRLSRTREQRRHRFAVGRRDNVLASTNGPVQAAGTLSMPLSSSELIELLLCGIAAGVTPTTPVGATAARLWTFAPGTTLASMTTEWYDGARGWEMPGTYVNSLTFAGTVGGENLVTAELFGKDLVAATITASLADRVPDFIEGWETKIYIEALSATPGTTVIVGAMTGWNVTLANNLGRKYFADNTQATGAVVSGELEVTASVTFEASTATALTEFTNWNAETARLVRLEFGQNDVIETTLNKFVTIDIPMAWGAVDLGREGEGTREYELSGAYLYDPTNAFGIQIRAQNSRAAAWA